MELSRTEAADLAAYIANTGSRIGSFKSRIAERSVVEQQVAEGKVLAPTAGRVLTVPVTTGTVVLAGEPVATVAEGKQHRPVEIDGKADLRR